MVKLHLVLLGAAGLITFSSCGTKKKEVDVPEKVKTALLNHFPDAKEISWEKETSYEWEADFRMYENKYSANFDSDGKMLVMEYDIDVAHLPKIIIYEIDSVFKGYQIKKAEHAEKDESQFYEIELSKGDKKLEVVYDESGNMLNNEDRSKELNDGDAD